MRQLRIRSNRSALTAIFFCVAVCAVVAQMPTKDAQMPSGARDSEEPSPGLAAIEFRKIIEHPGMDPLSFNIPLAHLGLARALGMQGDSAGSRGEYEKLFAFWKDADADLPVLLDAKREYAKLSPASTKRASN